MRTLLTIAFLMMFVMFCANSVQATTAYCGVPASPGGPPPDHRPPCGKCQEHCKKSPCYAAWGNYAFSATDLSIPTRGFPLTITRGYDSARAVDGILGFGWTSNLTLRLTYVSYLLALPSTYQKKAIVVLGEDRYEFTENPDGTTFTPPSTSHDTLIKNADATFDLTPSLTRAKYHFAPDGALQWMEDDHANRLNFLYDGNGRLYRIDDATGSGRHLDIFYNANGRIDYIQDSTNRRVNYGYNATDGTLTTMTDAVNRRTRYSYLTGRLGPLLSQIKDEWNRVVADITYDTTAGSVTIDRVLSYTEAGETYSYQYFSGNNPFKTVKTDSSGNIYTFTYNSQGQVTLAALPGGASTSTVFNADGSVQQTTDEENVTTVYTYNANGSVASVTRGSGSIQFNYAYQDANFPEKVTAITSVFASGPNIGQFNPDWQAWRYDYYSPTSTAPGALNHVYRVESSGSTLDTLATYTYNTAGQVLTVTDGSDAVTTYGYNAVSGDLTSVTYPKNSDSGANPIYQYGRDPLGRVSSVTDPLTHITSYLYDNADRITSVTLPKPSSGSTLNFTTTYSYDNFDSPSGLVFTNQTDPNARITKQGYDQYGQLIKSTDASNNTTTFTYTKGLLTSISDANNNVTGYSYDAHRRLSTTTFPDTLIESYTYWKDGLLKTKTDRKNQMLTYNYDAFKRLAQKVYPNSASVTYTYTGQKLTTVSDTLANETHSFSYDNSYRVSSNTQASRGTVNYLSFDGADHLSSGGLSGGPTTTWTYYADGNMRTITSTQISGNFQYNYTLNGQYQTMTMPNGQHRDYNYDDQGRLLQVANIHPTAGNLATNSYGYDVDNNTGQSTMLGQRTSLTATVPAQNFSNSLTKYYYDTRYQLTRSDYPNVAPLNAEIDSWTYDAIGNRLTNTVNGSTQNYTYYKNGSNPLNGQRLQSDSSKTYTYDSNGNLIGDGTYTYTCDYENRLTAISGPSLNAAYAYDYLGRRASRTVNSSTTTYIYDGQNLIAERGASTGDYVFGSGIDEPLAQSRGGVAYYYAADGLGSTTVLNNSSGAVQDNYLFDSWGIPRSQTAAIANPFGYTSREFAEVGLDFYRARHYNPQIGRFISEDPLENLRRFLLNIKAGRFLPARGYNHLRQQMVSLGVGSQYAYVFNAPLTFRDPFGREGEEPKPPEPKPGVPVPPRLPPDVPDPTDAWVCAQMFSKCMDVCNCLGAGRVVCFPGCFAVWVWCHILLS